ncbi:MAG: alpha-rhamnosidase [Pedobacter sp.]|nr:MAG: alpha-rhamnosidase [Pedobacter sp.]
MKIFKSIILFFVVIFGSSVAEARQDILKELKTEYLISPIGLDNEKPRFSWKFASQLHSNKQTSYQILVGTDSLGILKETSVVWSTSKVNGDENIVTYNGEKLKPFNKYYWSLIIWDKNAVKHSSKVQSFEMGMMSMANWTGDWISDEYDQHYKPAPYFRKKITLQKTIKSARIYIAAAGLYELTLNGKKVGNHRLDPMYTRFDRRNLYLTHDVTTQLQRGDNAIGVLLGNGWYNHQSTAVWNFDKALWRARPTFCLDLRITYTDGSTEVITSGKDWKTSPSPIVFNSIYTAEHYNALLEQPNWNKPSFNDEAWKEATLRPAPSQLIIAQAMHPVRDIDTIKPVSLKKLSSTSYLYNIGQNISGVSEIRVKGTAGTELQIVHAELLDKNGMVDLGNIDYHYRPSDTRDPFQTDIFTLSGKGTETFRAKFNYKGFQYVQITSNKPIELDEKSLVAYFMHSDVPAVGRINSSNETLNKIWKATNNSYLSNLFGYPTDCPQREKNGWTGDAHITIETALYNFDGITIYEKWLADHRDEQQPNGVLPAIIPTAGWGYTWANGPDWTSTIAIIPWQIYQFYGDTKILADNYSSMRSYAEHIKSISVDNLTDWGLGDWVPVKSKSVVKLTSSIYYYTVVDILAKSARVLNKNEDVRRYTQLATEIKNAINATYLNKETGIYATGTQTEMSSPLYWGIVPPEMKVRVAANLAEKVKADGYKIDVGLLGSKTILNALSENGYVDIAYNLASRETYPSWGWWIKNGATTLMENWDVTAVKDNSQNHIMFGEIGAWYFKALGGIKPDSNSPGFKNVILEPQFVKGLEHFEASYNGRFGLISSSWKRQGSEIIYLIDIPANSTATLILPSKSSISFFDKNAKGNKINLTKQASINHSDKITYQLPSGKYYAIIN